MDWYPWGDEAFAKASAENKPISLSIGYSTCHWWHVMADESFANEETAEFLNEHFVSIKVDREERPDVDHIYMSFVQAATGSGGWPLNVWLTPERKPFFGGVYFAPEDRGRRPGFPTVLQHLADLWADDSDRVRDQSEQMITALAEQMAPVPNEEDLPWEYLRDEALTGFSESYDSRHGGFDPGEKFPSGPTLELLLDLAVTHPEIARREHAREMLTTTLEAIATQGLHDHVGGGFHRYTVDAAWGVPHFEKMLFDQAQIAHAMLSAWQLTERSEFRSAAESALNYVSDRLTHPAGQWNSESHLANLNWKVNDQMSLTGYSYLLSFKNAAANSTVTHGLFISGSRPISDSEQLTYRAEYAQQSEYEKSPLNYEATYSLIEIGLKNKKIGLTLGREVLGSDHGTAFKTPLATGHAFNGWADLFLGTPSAGLEDLYAKVTANLPQNIKGAVVYHRFQSHVTGQTWGHELDFSAARAFGPNLNVLLKGAVFDGDYGRPDVTKFWLQAVYTF